MGCVLMSGLVAGLRKGMAAIFLLALACAPLCAQKPETITEEIEWTWEVRPPHPDPQLPNVLLLGDSISRNYFPEVRKDLEGVANVYLMASSTCVGDPRLEPQIAEFAKAEKVRFRVVHFNNGMHGWDYTEAQYKAAFPGFLRAVRGLAEKDGTLIWTNTTPVRADANKDANGVVKSGPTNARVDERNSITLELAKAAGITVDDQHALMLQHQDLHEDAVHFNEAGAKIQGDQAASLIRAALHAGAGK